MSEMSEMLCGGDVLRRCIFRRRRFTIVNKQEGRRTHHTRKFTQGRGAYSQENSYHLELHRESSLFV